MDNTEQVPQEGTSKWRRPLVISLLLLLVGVASLSQDMSTAFAQQVEDIYEIDPPDGCPYGAKVYAQITSGYGSLQAFASGYNDATDELSYSYTAYENCLQSSCNWLHITDYPDEAEYGAGSLNHWLRDHAYSESSIDITTAWCSFNTPPHDTLEEIKDENKDGSIIDDLERHLKKRGSDPLPERAKKELEDQGK